MEHGTGQESDEPMYLHVAGPDPSEVLKAKELCEDLLKNVREQYEEFKSRPQQQRPYGGTTGYGGERGYGDRAPDRSGPYGNYAGGYGASTSALSASGGAMAISAAPGATNPSSTADYAAQYAQYYGAGADPYAAYGGYAAYVQYYQQYMAAATAQQQQALDPATSPAPPPPPSEAPPPPPASAPGAGNYKAVSEFPTLNLACTNLLPGASSSRNIKYVKCTLLCLIPLLDSIYSIEESFITVSNVEQFMFINADSPCHYPMYLVSPLIYHFS